MATTNLTSLKANALSNVVSTVLSTTGVSSVPKITTITYPGDDTAANTGGGQTISISGTGFNTGASVIVNGTPASVVSVVSATSLTFTAPAQSSGTYALYVVNTDGGTAIAVPGISYSGTPTWSTASGSLGTVYETNAISNTVTATGDATIAYSLLSGTLPTGSTLNTANGLISGTSVATESPTTYSFTIRATDGQNQDTDRAFSITISPDTVTWSSPADGYITNLYKDTVMSTFTMSASSAAGKSITYTANSLPTGLSLSGATIIGTPTVEANSGSLITATAATTGRTATRTFNWVVIVGFDTYWPYTVLLLNGEGSGATNNANNSVVVDSSSNAFPVTVKGGTHQGSFSPFSARGWSNYFAGPSNYLNIASNTALNLSTGNFTIEAWIYWNGSNVSAVIASKDGVSGTSYPSYSFSITSSKIVGTLGSGNGVSSVQTITPTSTTIPTNTWTHVAFVKNSTTLTLYQNGISVATATQTATITDGGKDLVIGYEASQGNNFFFGGYICDFRIVKGTAVYTGAFTPSTSPLTAIAGTSVLTCQSNRFIDNSTNKFAITRTGAVAPTKFTPFNGTADYSPTTHGGGIVFINSTDALTMATNAAFDFGTGDFTFEFWMWLPATGASGEGAFFSGLASGSTDLVWYQSTLRFGRNGIAWDTTSSTVSFGLQRWYHIAFVKTSGTAKIFVDGVSVASASNGNTYSSQGGSVIFGSSQDGSRAFAGIMANIRAVKGTAVYTADFTPPTSPLTAISGTSFLLNGTNAGIIDQTGMSNIRINGSSGKIITGAKKYGSGSISLTAANGDYLTYVHPTAFPDAFTIEMWFYATISQSDKYLFSGPGVPFVLINGTMGLGFGQEGSIVATTATNYITTGTWYHIAYVRQGTGVGQAKLYLDGALALTNNHSTSFAGGSAAIGAYHTGTQPFTGYIDDFRISNFARYTTTFTAPSAPFTLR